MTAVDLQANIDKSFYRLIASEGQGTLADDFVAKRPSAEERIAAGKALRRKVPRNLHAAWTAPTDRPDPVAILEAQNATRVQKLVPVRTGRMLASPFSFLRGSAAVMASDLSRTAVSGLRVAACGDMHVKNFGVYASAERNLIFAINDFDEVHVGPWEWDLKRLATSAAVAARFMGGDRVAAEQAARACVRAYRKRMRAYAGMGYLEIWYDRIDERAVLGAMAPRTRRIARRVIDKARTKGHIRALDKLTRSTAGEHRIVENVPLIVRETHTDNGTPIKEALDLLLKDYVRSLPLDRQLLLSRYRIVDVARKVVGVGSVGTACWIILLQGLDQGDPLFLQVKQAQASVLAPHVNLALPFEHEGRRVVFGQRLTQGSPDIFLGWARVQDKEFYVRQMADMKGGAELAENDAAALAGFTDYCGLCGRALAHAKSGDPAMIAGYCGNSDELDEAIGRFALRYARQTDRDHDALAKAVRSGRLAAVIEAGED